MNTTQQLTAQDLALYIGCLALYGGDLWIVDSVRYISGSVMLVRSDRHGRPFGDTVSVFNVEEIKPLLRPLSDITEKEARECYQIRNGAPWYSMRPCLRDWWKDADEVLMSNSLDCIGHPGAWRYLLAQGFDLFDWIPAGLAIDKTKHP